MREGQRSSELGGRYYVWKPRKSCARAFSVNMGPHMEMDSIQAINKAAGDDKKDSASGHSSQDPEKAIQVGSGPELQRKLKSRHLQMIAIGSLHLWTITSLHLHLPQDG